MGIVTQYLPLCEVLPIRDVARRMWTEHPEVFTSLEYARTSLRRQRGAVGEADAKAYGITERKLSTIAEGIAKIRRQPEDPDNEVSLFGKIGIISDVHIPYHVPESVAIALDYIKAAGCKHLVLGGDIVDFYGCSRFTREIGRMTVEQELVELRAFLELVTDEFETVTYKMGNHEERLRAYILNNAKDIAGLPSLNFSYISGCDDLGITVVRRNRVMLGKLAFLHGHELPHGIAAPVNPARGVYLRTHSNCIVGHHHQISHHTEADLNENYVGCWSIGCLCRLNPEYMPYAGVKWRHGFAIVEVDDDGSFHVENKQIIGGRVR